MNLAPLRHFIYLTLLSMVCSATLSYGDENTPRKSKEYHIKALFLYNFANYVEWPNDAFASKDSPLRMCLYGKVPFGSFLDAVNGARIRERVLNVIRSSEYKDIDSGCHILFVGTDQLDQIEDLFKNINHLFVLSIGSVSGFTDKGGIVNILRTRDQQKFDINLAKAIENGLLIDSDLLALARIINR